MSRGAEGNAREADGAIRAPPAGSYEMVVLHAAFSRKGAIWNRKGWILICDFLLQK